MTPHRPATRLRDVADAAGVSATTVSHALSGKGRVDPATAERVREAADRLGYRPNPTARNLRRGRTGLLGLVNSVDPNLPVALTDLEHFVRLVSAASATALGRGYPLVLAPPADLATFERAPVDGLIILDPIAQDPLIAHAQRLKVPAVTVGRDPTRSADEGCWVDNDLVAATVTALDHLHAAGAARIAFITPPPVHSWGVDMIDGYRAWASDHGSYERIATAEGGLTESAGHTAALALLGDPEPPDAIYCAVDRYALGAVLAARACSLQIPDDLLLVAATDSQITHNAKPPLTALDLHPEQAGHEAVELIIECLEGQPEHPRLTITTDLVERQSTRRSVATAAT
jgi:DNA-binding LacI/PurR family transcriptional regulator